MILKETDRIGLGMVDKRVAVIKSYDSIANFDLDKANFLSEIEGFIKSGATAVAIVKDRVFFYNSTDSEFFEISSSSFQPDQVVQAGTISNVGNNVTIDGTVTSWIWRISNLVYENSTSRVFAITPPAAGNFRYDIITGDNTGAYAIVNGTPAASSDAAIIPTVPSNRVGLGIVFSNDTGVTEVLTFALSAFVRFDISNQPLTAPQRANARGNIQAVSKDTDDTRTGGLTNEGKVTVDLDEASAALPIVEIKQQGVTKHVFTGDEARIIPHLLRVNSPIAPTVRGASFRGSTNGGDPVFEIQNAAGTKIFYPRGTGGIGQLRSNASDESIRRDENYLTFPATVAGTGKLNDVALADGVGMVKFAATVTEVSGIVSNNADQKELLVWTDNTDGITLTEQDTDSVAANRFLRQINVPYRTPVRIVYESSTGRWVNGNTGELQETDARYFEVVDDVLTLKYILPDISALQAFVRGPAVLAYVSDPVRGGFFNYVAEADFVGSPDFGISFPAQDGGYWVRDFENEVLGDWYITDISTGYDITNALIFCIENNLNFKGRKTHKYIITSEIEFATYSNITFDFGGAEITDNITAYWPVEAAGRAAPLFTIYNTNNVTVKNFTWIKGASRSNLVDEGVPTFIFWVGGQFLGSDFTWNIDISNVTFNDCTSIGFGGIGFIGEVFNSKVFNLEFTGAWSYGLNFEFGEAPEDPAVNPSFENGQHPYNIEVKNVKGIDMPNTRGFLRTASTFNITFTNCVGSNVKSFIMVFGGDKDISRFGQNITFINCNHHSGGVNQLAVSNYVVNILFPNEFNGSPLPAWTNLNHNITFINCEFQCNSVVGSANIRFSGNQGKTLFKNVILRNGYYGVRTGLTTGITYTSVHSLELDNCQFLNLHQPLSIRNIKGVLVRDSKFENSVGTLIPVVLDNATHCRFINNYFGSLQNDNTQIHIEPDSPFTILDNNEFTSFTTRPILAEAITFGKNNLPRLTVLSNDPDTEANRYQIIGEPVTSIYQITGSTTNLDASKAINYTLPSISFSMDRIIGGVNGDVVSIDAIGVSASLTLTNLAAGAGNNKLFLKGNADLTIEASSTDLFGVKFKKYPAYWKQIDGEDIVTPSPNTALAVGATYDQARVQAILDELRDLKTKMRTAGLLAT